MVVGIIVVYVLAFLTLGIGTMIAVQAQREHEDTEPEPGDIPESIEVKRHRPTGMRYW